MTNYKLYQSVNSGTFSLVDGSMGVVNAYSVTGLITGSVYKYKLIASNAVGDGPESLPSAGIIAAIPSTPPINLSRVYSDGTMITFKWDSPVDSGGIPVTDYQVLWNYGNAGTSFVS